MIECPWNKHWFFIFWTWSRVGNKNWIFFFVHTGAKASTDKCPIRCTQVLSSHMYCYRFSVKITNRAIPIQKLIPNHENSSGYWSIFPQQLQQEAHGLLESPENNATLWNIHEMAFLRNCIINCPVYCLIFVLVQVRNLIINVLFLSTTASGQSRMY